MTCAPPLLKHIIFMACIMACCCHITAQPFSFVYIQGDKQEPFYVKMEGKMLPRYGKDYCIISELRPGVIHIEVLFQQNRLPSQKFAIRVPENGSRSLLLDKQNRSYALYDLQTKKYLDIKEEEK